MRQDSRLKCVALEAGLNENCVPGFSGSKENILILCLLPMEKAFLSGGQIIRSGFKTLVGALGKC